jgi:hypothetical protein
MGAVAAALVLALAGCSSDDEPSSEPTGDGSSSSTGSTPTDGASETSSTSPSVTPATGPRIDAEVVSYRLPEADWLLTREGQSANFFDEAGYSWRISSSPAVAISHNVERQARSGLELAREDYVGAKRLADRSVAGVEGYVLEAGGRRGADRDGLFYEYGTVHGDHTFSIYFEFPENSPRAQEWVESVLASFEWK